MIQFIKVEKIDKIKSLAENTVALKLFGQF